MHYSAASFLSRLCVMLEDKVSQAHAEHTSGSDTGVLREEFASNSTSQRSCGFECNIPGEIKSWHLCRLGHKCREIVSADSFSVSL